MHFYSFLHEKTRKKHEKSAFSFEVKNGVILGPPDPPKKGSKFVITVTSAAFFGPERFWAVFSDSEKTGFFMFFAKITVFYTFFNDF